MQIACTTDRSTCIQPIPVQSQRVQLARKHVFCVNSSSPLLDVVRALLEEEEYHVTTTRFVPHTYEQIVALQPQLLIVDVVVGIDTGWCLLERLRGESTTRPVPIIVTSTNDGLLHRARHLLQRNGTANYLSMPFDIDTMLNMVENLIGPA